MKKFVVGIIIFFLSFTNSVTYANMDKNNNSKIISKNQYSNPFFNEEKEEIGTTYSVFTVQEDYVNNHRRLTITIDKKHVHDIGLVEFEKKVDEIIYINDDKALINGKMVNLNTPIVRNPHILKKAGDHGGFHLTAYIEQTEGKYKNAYKMRSYPKMESMWQRNSCLFLDGSCEGIGKQMFKTAYKHTGSSKEEVRWFIKYADDLDDYEKNIGNITSELLFMLGVTAIPVGGIMALIGSSGASAFLAKQLYDNYSSAYDTVPKAYEYLKEIKDL